MLSCPTTPRVLTCQVPFPLRLVPYSLQDSRIESRMLVQPQSRSCILYVLQYLRPASHEATPVMLRREGKGVNVYRNIAGQAGIPVCKPGASDIVLEQ